MASSSAPSHVTESISDRKKSRELAEARQSGAVAPEVDVKTGSMINPHNPEFITRRPWYLGGNDAGPSLDHQADQRTEAEKLELSMTSADRLVQLERDKQKKEYWKQQRGETQKIKWKKGMWVEAMKGNKLPYLICEIVKYDKKGHLFWLKYEDGSVEKKVKFHHKQKKGLYKQSKKDYPRIRLTKAGSRSFAIDHSKYGKETYDSKRDKYHGYDATSNQHMKMMELKYTKRDMERRKRKEIKQSQNDNQNTASQQNQKDKSHNDSDSDSDTDYDSDSGSDSDDEFVQRDEDTKTFTSRLARQGGVGGAQMKVTARNLRIREDTAKYLRNLDLNSAYYDPKSRSMRDNPNPNVNPEELQFAGDNFARVTGDAVGLAKTQVFAWDCANGTNNLTTNNGSSTSMTTAAALAGGEIHPQANPSQVELMKKKFDTKTQDMKESRKQSVLEKYGGAQYLDGGDGIGGASLTPSSIDNNKSTTKTSGETLKERMVRFGASVINHEYTRDGRVLTSNGIASTNNASKNSRIKLKSKYEEDVFINGHSTVWGSYFHVGAFRWGYADDHSLMKNSYCTGVNGRIANDDANELKYGTGLSQKREMLTHLKAKQAANSAQVTQTVNATNSKISKSKLYGEADQSVKLDEERVREEIKREEQRLSSNQEIFDDRKRKFNSMKSSNDVTEEEMEAYRLKKGRADDPMLKLTGDELLEYK